MFVHEKKDNILRIAYVLTRLQGKWEDKEIVLNFFETLSNSRN